MTQFTCVLKFTRLALFDYSIVRDSFRRTPDVAMASRSAEFPAQTYCMYSSCKATKLSPQGNCFGRRRGTIYLALDSACSLHCVRKYSLTIRKLLCGSVRRTVTPCVGDYGEEPGGGGRNPPTCWPDDHLRRCSAIHLLRLNRRSPDSTAPKEVLFPHINGSLLKGPSFCPSSLPLPSPVHLARLAS